MSRTTLHVSYRRKTGERTYDTPPFNVRTGIDPGGICLSDYVHRSFLCNALNSRSVKKFSSLVDLQVLATIATPL